jgi:hypothetical protein
MGVDLVDPPLVVFVFGGTKMKRLLAAALCLTGISATAQNLNLKGRVLDKANMKGVPGAMVKVVGSTASATTDTAGRFVLTGSSGIAGNFTRMPAEPYLRNGALYVEAVLAGLTARVEVFGASGETLGAMDRRLAAGWNRIDALPGADGDFLGYARITVGNQTWVKTLLHTGGNAPATWLGGDASVTAGYRSPAKTSAASAATAAGQVEVSADKLMKKTVAYANDASDLGDIVLDYPERKLGVGVAPIYGATVLFDGSKGKTAAAAELQAKWKDWPRFEPSDIKFRIVRDPEFPNDTANHAALQSCCNTNWGYDDIQATVGMFQDFQVHVEFIGMGEYDKPAYDIAAPNPNVADASASGNPGYINSGVYVASRYEVQIQSFTMDQTKIPGNHDMGSIVDAFPPLGNQNKPNGVWQAYDITFRGARFNGTTMSISPYMSVWWNGVQIHNNRKVPAGASGLSNHSGEEHNDPIVYGLKLQSEGRDVRYRNIWIKPLAMEAEQTNFGY